MSAPTIESVCKDVETFGWLMDTAQDEGWVWDYIAGFFDCDGVLWADEETGELEFRFCQSANTVIPPTLLALLSMFGKEDGVSIVSAYEPRVLNNGHRARRSWCLIIKGAVALRIAEGIKGKVQVKHDIVANALDYYHHTARGPGDARLLNEVIRQHTLLLHEMAIVSDTLSDAYFGGVFDADGSVATKLQGIEIRKPQRHLLSMAAREYFKTGVYFEYVYETQKQKGWHTTDVATIERIRKHTFNKHAQLDLLLECFKKKAKTRHGKRGQVALPYAAEVKRLKHL